MPALAPGVERQRAERGPRGVPATGARDTGAVQLISRLADVADRYDALLCDVWGVLHDGVAAYPEAVAALRWARASGIGVVLVTNMPRPRAVMPAALAKVGVPRDCWDEVVTSGDLTRVELAARAPGPVHLLGRVNDRVLWEGLGLHFVEDLADAQFLAIASLERAEQDPNEYLPELRAARVRDLELVCANPDLQVSSGGKLRWVAGAVADLYGQLGGRVVQVGKPHAPIYARARAVTAELAGREIADSRILAIGDGIGTDLLGANRQGLDSLFIATGMNGDTLRDGSGRVDPARANAAVAAGGATATYALPVLR